MNLISGTHHSREWREYAFIVLQEYTKISQLVTNTTNGLILSFSGILVILIIG